MKALLHILVSKFIFIWTTKNLHNRFWMNAKGFSHSGIIRAESPNLFCVIYIKFLSAYTIQHDRYVYLDVRWAVSLYYTNVLIQMTHLHSNVLQLAIEFSEIIYVHIWHVDLKLIQIFIFRSYFYCAGVYIRTHCTVLIMNQDMCETKHTQHNHWGLNMHISGAEQ